MNDALTVDLIRGHPDHQTLESTHRVDAVVVHPDRTLVEAWGDPDRLVFPRSAVKPIQALPLVESGAADAFGLTTTELALACASHNGEPGHVQAVESWLERIGCSAHDLECGIQSIPGDGRLRPSPVANNCSGKHAGFLTVCRHLGFDTKGYIRADHPVQNLVTHTLAAFTSYDVDVAERGTDGCGIPAYPIPLHALAASAARVAASSNEPADPRADAVQRLASAMVAEPWFVAGTHRMATEVLGAAGGSIVVKDGAEGVQWAALPNLGLGIAVKCVDGSGRASEAALGYVLEQIGATAASSVFSERCHVANWAGTHVADLVVR